MKKNNKVKGVHVGSLCDVLRRAKVNTVIWTEAKDSSCATTAIRSGRKIKTQRFHALDVANLNVIQLTRIQIIK